MYRRFNTHTHRHSTHTHPLRPFAPQGLFALGITIMYCLAVLFSFQLIDMLSDPGDAELYFGTTVAGQVLVGIVVLILVLSSLAQIRSNTRNWRNAYETAQATAKSRRNSNWRIIRLAQLYIELRGPNSPWSVMNYPPPPTTTYVYQRSLSRV